MLPYARVYTEVCATCCHPSPPQGALRALLHMGGDVFKTSRSTRRMRALAHGGQLSELTALHGALRRSPTKPSATVTAIMIAHKCFALLNFYRRQISVHAHVPKFQRVDELLPPNQKLLSPSHFCQTLDYLKLTFKAEPCDDR